MNFLLHLGAMIAMGFLGFKLYEVQEALEWAIPCWLLAMWFGWELFEGWLRELTPWRHSQD